MRPLAYVATSFGDRQKSSVLNVLDFKLVEAAH